MAVYLFKILKDLEENANVSERFLDQIPFIQTTPYL